MRSGQCNMRLKRAILPQVQSYLTHMKDGKLPNGLRNKSPGKILTLTRSGKASESAGGGDTMSICFLHAGLVKYTILHFQ